MSGHSRGKAQGVERLYLDFDSFFATAEQHFNPALRGRPVGVVPLDSPHTGCIAVSREAKALGVKSGAKIVQAREMVPDMIFVVARHDVYVRLHNRIVDVIETCLPVAHVRSIDEVVCHLKSREAQEGQALAQRIKDALAVAFSPELTCSIGMAPTELLAKIGAEMNKPDGFMWLSADDLPQALEHLPLTDLPGISNGIETRLAAGGVETFRALWGLAPKQARALWGNVEGERFWNGLHGYHVERPKTVKRMFGHSRMLPVDWRNHTKVCMCARQLTVSASRRLRRADLRATKLTLGFRGGGYRSNTSSQQKDKRWHWEGHFLPARDDHTLLSALADGLERARRGLRFPPRSVSVMIHGLTRDEDMTQDLFDVAKDGVLPHAALIRQNRWEGISDLMDQLRLKYGPNALSLGPVDEAPGGYLGAKIAFGRIPDAADFNEAPVDDAATHFCKT